MSRVLFDRSVAVTIGSRKTGDAKKFIGLRTIFQVEKTSESFPNTAKISIYNLAESSRALVRATDPFVMLEVGYGGDLSILYVGDISRAYISRQGPDWVTTAECGDGLNAIRRVSVDKSYAAGTDYKTIIRDVAKTLVDEGKVALGSLLGIESKIARRGDVVSGASKDELDRLTENQGLEWSIQNNTLQVNPKDQALADDAILLTPETGLVDVPVLRDTKYEKTGVEFQCLIVPKIAPGRLVRIRCEQNKTVNGFYKVESVNFSGDTHGQAWNANGTAVAI